MLICFSWLVECSFRLATVMLAAQSPDSFSSQWDYLCRQPADEVGRDAKVAAYQEFIKRYEKDPRVAEVMMAIAGLMEGDFSAQNLKPDHEAALTWYRSAVDRATPGSPLWTKASFYLAGRLTYVDTAETRQILQRIAKHAGGDSLTLARIEHELQQVCLRENDWEGAEVHCRRVLGWYYDPARVPKDQTAKFELDSVIRGAGGAMVFAFTSAPWPKRVRKEKIEALVNSYPGLEGLYDDGELALAQLPKMSEVPEIVVFEDKTDSRTRWRWALTIAALVVLVGIGYLTYRRPWRTVA